MNKILPQTVQPDRESQAKKIILVEDDSMMRQRLTRLLKAKKFEVTAVEGGGQALDILKNSRPDMILCDVIMPDLDGFNVLQSVKSTRETALIPFIFLSGKSDRSAIRQGMSLGADDYLVKPFTPDELLGAIRSQLEKRTAFHAHTSEKVSHKSHLLSSVMHDFRSPLAILLLSIDTLQEEMGHLGKMEREELLNDMRQQITQMSRMLEDLLVLGRLETDPGSLSLEDVDLADLCDQVIKEVLVLDRFSHPIKMAAANPPGLIHTNQLLLRQIIVNLLVNAVKYTPAEKPVWLHLQREENHALIKVQDQGIGISQEDQLHIFKPFARGQNTGDIGGTGYGLYIVKQYLDQIGGEISLRSSPGAGSCFIVQLPLKGN